MSEQGSGAGSVSLAWLGAEPIINAGGTNTKHSGTRPRDEALQAMLAASERFYNLDELLLSAGARIAELVGAEAATVTSGASGGLVVQAAAAIARDDPEKILALPLTDGMPNELIIQRHHRFGYDHLYLVPGARFAEVGDGRKCAADQVEQAITDQTVGIIHLESPFTDNMAVPLPRLAEVAHDHGLPLLCDAASMLPPRTNLRRFLDEGADLISFSGGKGIRGPQSTGILLGTEEWIEYARLNNAPNATVARSQKVSKEEIAGLVAALEAFTAEDEEAENQRYRAMMNAVVDQIAEIPGVDAVVEHDRDHAIPHAVVYFTSEWRGPDRNEIHRRLMAGRPRVYLTNLGKRGEIWVDPLNIQEGELEIVAERLREELVKAASGQ